MTDDVERPSYEPVGVWLSDRPKRRFWQIHLSTAIVMVVVAGLMLPLVTPYLKSDPFDFQGPAADAEWNLSDTVKDFDTSVANKTGPYSISLAKKPKAFFLQSEMLVSLSPAKEICKLDTEAGSYTPFVIENNTIYYADYCPISTGCRLIAYDLKENRHLWVSYLMGIGGTGHSRYSNNVCLKKKGDDIVVYGDESHGKYIEFVDMKTGATVGHRAFDLLDIFPRPSPSDAIVPILFILAVVFIVAFVFEWMIR